MAEVRLSEQLESEIVQDTGHLQGTCGEGGKCEELAAAAETGKQFIVPLTPTPLDLETFKSRF
jgi:hypothetical protein